MEFEFGSMWFEWFEIVLVDKTEKTSFGCVRGLTPLVVMNGFVFW